ncbi:hypothetical protein HUT13_13905 [Streptomyces harbinensis]|uniref:DUF6049 family protein n=1 Tax=Streptomyces harbinensis TaxID=1176198 RepID=UPI001591DE80|nr:DUF6049 family protein [Streptomyces harbinensis]QKV69753.1 hypothetical protein HUT13_13905 [Streptomyces harbinensis]
MISRAHRDRRPGPALRRARLIIASLLSLLVVLPLVTALQHAPGSAPAQDAGTGQRTATISLTEITPGVPTEGDTLTLRGTVTNAGSSAITDSRLAPRTGTLLPAREDLQEALERTGFAAEQDGRLVNEHGQDISTIAPGMSATFDLRVPVSALELGEDGVYQLALTLTGQTEAEGWDQILGVGRSLLPWQPSAGGPASGTELTVLWPLISSTHLTAETDADEEQTPAFRDSSLLTDISPGGRLHELVTLGADLPVTWVIDADLLASVDAMTEDYRIHTPDGLQPGTGQEAARAWLAALQDAVQDDDVIALPFGDPDLASLAHRGKDVPGALGRLRTATEVSALTVETVLGVQPSTDFAWPIEGAIDPDIVSVATSAGAHHIISRSDSLRPGDSLDYTATAARPIGGGTTALVADATLSTLFEADMSLPANATTARQQFLAEALTIARQDPGRDRSLLLAPQRTPTADQARAMAEAITALTEHPQWISFTGLTEAADAQPDPGANRQVPSTGAYPDRLRDQELPTSAFQEMRETQRTLDDFQVILTRPDRVTTPFGNAIRREMSTSWRGHATEAAQYRATVQSDLTELTERVHLIQKTRITLSGRSATIPISVQNNLVQGVQNLELRLTSSRKIGLEVGDPQQVTVNGGHSASVKFSTTARANGLTYLEAQLYTADGKPYGKPMRFQAQVTSITSAVLMVIAGGLLLVVLAGVRMYTKRKRAARPADEAPDGAVPAGESGTDTGDDGTGTPPDGERVDRSE